MMIRNTIEEVLSLLENSDYIDPAEHLYDAIKVMKRHLREENDDDIILYVGDFLWGLSSPTIIDTDGKVEKCIEKIKDLINT